jgi:iron complex outermembrane receptor protein
MEKLMTRNVLKPLGSIRVALAIAVGLPLLIVSNAFAQLEPAPAPEATPVTGTNIPTQAGGQAEVERVIVTGSNIPTAEEVGPNPVDTYRRDDIARLGVRTATDLVRALPAATGASFSENNNNGGDGGAVSLNLRGIFPKETLVLQDGRRVANAGFASDTVDINTFPVELIDHIDVLKDGASAIYGSDAVSGVFNVWLIHRFRGLELGAQYGNTNIGFAGDSAEERAWLLAGTGDDKTDIVVFAEWYNRAAIFSRDVDVSHNPEDFRNFGGQDVRSGNYAGRVQGRAFFPQFNGGAKTPTPHAFPNAATDPEYASIFARGVHHAFFNFAALTPEVAAADRQYFYGSLIRDICDKYLTVFADFKYARTFYDGAFAPAPIVPDMWTDANFPFGISGGGFSVPTQNAFNPFTVGEYISPGGFNPSFPGTQVSAAPAGTEFTTGVRYRGLEAGLRTSKITTNNYVFTGGLKGELGEFGDYLKNWTWETAFRYSEDYRVARFGGIINNNAFRAALLDTDPRTAFNPFGRSVNTPAVLRKVFITTNEIGDTSVESEDLKLNGDLFNLPAGPLSFAIGADHRREHTSDQPDPLTVSGQTTGATAGEATKGTRDAWSTFWEIRVPVTSPTWNFPGLYSLELNYQERYDNFSDFGDTERPKVSARWQPLDSAWTIRATYNEAFHAPTLGELFQGTVQSFPTITDPLGFTTENQIESRSTGNPNLKPETAYEWTYGTIITPGKWWSALQGLTVSGDFYHVDVRGLTSTLDAQFIVDNETTFPGQVLRDPTSGALLVIFTPIQNLGRAIEEGYDYEMVYTFETTRLGHGDWGTLTTTMNGTYLDRAVIQTVPGGPEEIVVGKYGGGFLGPDAGGAFNHNRWYASIFYDGAQGTWLGGLDTGFTVHYIGQYWDIKARTAPNPGSGFTRFSDRKIREWTTADWILNYTFSMPAPVAATEVAGYAKDGGKGVKMKDGKDKNVMPVSTAEYNPCGWRAWLNNMTITLGINNITDEQPPYVAGNQLDNGYDQASANPKGRYWYAGVKKRF